MQRPESSYAPLQKQIDTLYANMTEMGKTILNLTDKVSKLDGGSVTLPEADEYPAWVAAHRGHMMPITPAMRLTYTDGKRYICQMDNCVWGPDVYTGRLGNWPNEERGTMEIRKEINQINCYAGQNRPAVDCNSTRQTIIKKVQEHLNTSEAHRNGNLSTSVHWYVDDKVAVQTLRFTATVHAPIGRTIWYASGAGSNQYQQHQH